MISYKQITSKLIHFLAIPTVVGMIFIPSRASATIIVDNSDPNFSSLVNHEIEHFKKGDRGLVCQALIESIEISHSTTTIRSLTSDEKTWHPNDTKGTRSHVVAADTLMRGAARNNPTNATIFIHPSRIDPDLSLYKLGTFAEMLAIARDLNLGEYSGDYRIRDRRSMFFRNAWRDSMGLGLYLMSERLPTSDYSEAKKRGILIKDNAQYFPILDPEKFDPKTH